MPAPAVRRATYQDVLDAPPNMIAEVIAGTLHTQPRPAPPHTNVSSNLGVVLGSRYRFVEGGGPGGWVLHDEPELHLGSEPDIIVPDLAGWHRGRLAGLSRERPFTTVVPNWVCEVLSPSTQRIDRALKMKIYLREQVSHVWLIDPLALTLEVYRYGGELWERTAIYEGDATVRAEPFEAAELQLAWLWEE
jgi:Uma2 family endonuclease